MGDLVVGCAGWHYTDWTGVLYPPHLPSARWLGRYASVFPVVEIDATFYALPSESTVQGWIEKVADRPGFAFAAKVPQEATHDALPAGATPQALAAARRFLEVVADPLMDAGRLEALLVQLPPRFHHRVGALADLVDLLDALDPRRRRVVVEFRHASWFDAVGRLLPDVAGALRERKVAVAHVDGLGSSPTPSKTTSWSYWRFHGRRGAVPQDERGIPHAPYNYLYSPHEVAQLGHLVAQSRSEDERTTVIFNNHYRGQAAKNALDLAEVLGQRAPVRLSVPKESRLDDFAPS